MYNNFPKQVLKEFNTLSKIDFDGYIEIHLCESNQIIENRFKDYLQSKDKLYLVRLGCESYHTWEQKSFVENLVEDYILNGYQIHLTTSAINKTKYGLHPLVSLNSHWRGLEQRGDITWNFDNSVTAFPLDKFPLDYKLKPDRKYKSILSVRKESENRSYLFSKISADTNSIFRFADYSFGSWTETEEKKDIVNEYPTWYELLDEYKESHLSFIYETEHSLDSTLDCQISEKTITALLCGTIPIVFGQYGFEDYMEEIGFKIYNKKFGFVDSTDFKTRLDNFIKCYNNIKNLSHNDIKTFWIKNQLDIQHNYNLMNNLLQRDLINENR